MFLVTLLRYTVNSMSDREYLLNNPVRQHSHSMQKSQEGGRGEWELCNSFDQAPEEPSRTIDL